ncbi:hypothetical protein MNBD_ALPHA06-1862 [hydrothermal vent metagenome]|uniref:PpiC domain-containing protein n=1 Tax=hydrothermal vent metagenome TaxID=652676 RepID=A0A3B0SKD4_9ZZZZ
MLEAMRNSLRSPIAKVFLLLIVLSFIVWGTGDIFRGGTGDAVVLVGPEKVTVEEFGTAWRQEVNYRIRTSDGKFSEAEAKAQGLDEQLLQRMISEAALDAKLSELGVSVSKRMLYNNIKDYEAFKDPLTGDFSDEQYVQALAQSQLTPKLFEDQAKSGIAREQILAVIREGAITPLAYTRNSINFQQETRQVESVILPTSAIPVPPQPTDEQLAEMLAENPRQFAIPERRAATLVMITAKDLTLDINPSDEELRAIFEFSKNKYTKVETRSWVQVPVDDQITADAVARRLQAGEAAADIMTDMKLAGTPIELTDADIKNSPDDQIAEAIFAAADGATGATEGRFKWAAWKINGITPGSEKTYEDVVEELRDDFIRSESQNKLFEVMGDFEGARSDGLTLDEAAEAQSLVVISLPPVDRRGTDENLNVVKLFEDAPEILATLFDLDELVESDIEETEKGDFYALTVDEIIPTRQPEMEEIKDALRSAWTLQQSSNAMRELASAVKKQMESGVPAAEISAKYPGSRVEIAILSRYEQEPSIPPGLAREMFSYAPGKVGFGVAGASNELVISKLLSIIQAPVIDDATLMLLRGRVDQEIGQDIEQQFINGLLSSYTIRRDEKLKALALGDG